MARPMPRLFLIRHGETEWSLNGRHTGRSDIPLTARGEQQMRDKAPILVGEGKAIDPKNLCVVFVSPRIRAHKTFHLLFEHLPGSDLPSHILNEEMREWDYGEYEGLLAHEIRERQPGWNIWHDGCPGGESVDEMRNRVDTVISKVRQYHKEYVEGGKNTRDVVIVAHGHFNRVFIARWLNFDLTLGTYFNVEPGGVTVLSYNHNSLDEPALNALNLHADLR
ncbi:phosphoglycerate mutase-like protein [Coniophora puteana RWD-64-598 SS2]|uniref:Phosphoglycerate mutase-like protein n=1 Tax=Coniophora puteana (strain RWD-64-598) TaxID=741705 RepID=A0A5M3N616_CONPW|nr:phosphoglycerate mutase-like protein [Coniophora puteana RWD-64-598 SS2]EIW86843.1 phosphoglycerate mutase-like protein [Coniophora puteana RWD-64-598 SS2]